MSEKKTTGWQNMRRQLDNRSKPVLIALVKDLHDASPDNRDFLLARFQVEDDADAALEKYRRKIVEQFFPARGDGKLKLAEARKAIRDYRKATGNLAGTIDLMLTYVENGTEFTHEFGDINESFYNSLESVLNEMAQLLMREGKELYPPDLRRCPARGDESAPTGVGGASSGTGMTVRPLLCLALPFASTADSL